MAQLQTIKLKAHNLNAEVYALYLSYLDTRVKWYVRVLLAFVIGYALSPIDFVPDLQAVFGFLDDVVVIAAGLSFSYQLLSKDVLGKARVQAYEALNGDKESVMAAYRIIGYTWMLAFCLLAIIVYKLLNLNSF
ncbi:YkvA family protein [Pontibacter harenae]|uniref:YkvA family protein n=1 Tax=Pontibacter harenae TaxID=2894083 RepID=UPI001E2E4983|nr:DUF1232 domain-containing protein [Pontibacter harenae]MCC9168184.1 DUF1232 domain-containing protein [Pontibacter harenae]